MSWVSPAPPIALTVLLSHTAPTPLPPPSPSPLEKLSSGKLVPGADKVGHCGFSRDLTLSEPLDPLLYKGDDKSRVGLKNKCYSWSQI